MFSFQMARLVQITPSTPCVCGSSKRFVHCCGVLLQRKDIAILVPAEQPHETPEFFLLGLPYDLYGDAQGRVPVFRTRAQVLRLREDTGSEHYGCIGLTGEGWARIRDQLAASNILWYEVPSSTIAA